MKDFVMKHFFLLTALRYDESSLCYHLKAKAEI